MKRITSAVLCANDSSPYNDMWVNVFGSDGQARKGGRMYVYYSCVVIRRENGSTLTLSPTTDEMWETWDDEFNRTTFALFVG